MKRGTFGKRFGMAMVVVAAVVALTACGGGGGSDPGPGGVAVVSTGTMTKGSVIVNGVTFTAAVGATIRVDDNPNRPEQELRNGMGVKVKGRINDDRVTGEYEKVEAEPEVRGQLRARGAEDFTVNGQKVFVDDLTEFEHRAADDSFTTINFGDLANDDEVEVHGGRDDQGRIRATRVERRATNAVDEVKGTISDVPNTTAKTFTLTNGLTSITVDYSSATITPAGATLSQNDFVQVHGSFDSGTSTFTATQVHREDLEDAEFEPAEGQEFEVEGFVTGFDNLSGDFDVDGRVVRTTPSTRFENGSSLDLGNNVRVEAEGHLQSGILVADKIKFKRSHIRILSTVTQSVSATQFKFFGSAGTGFLTVSTNGVTDNRTGGAIAQGNRIEVRGYEDKAGNIIASRIDSAGGGDDSLQGRVTAKTFDSGTNEGSLTILGITGSTTGSTVFSPADHSATMNPGAFYAAVIPASATSAGTLVKMKGTFSGTTADIVEAELEN